MNGWHRPDDCDQYHDIVRDFTFTRPVITTLCGSTRFRDEFLATQRDLTLKGEIVISVGLFGHYEGLDMLGPTKIMLDQLHLWKIELSDGIFVVSRDGYIGDSTRREIEFAESINKQVRYLEPLEAYA